MRSTSIVPWFNLLAFLRPLSYPPCWFSDQTWIHPGSSGFLMENGWGMESKSFFSCFLGKQIVFAWWSWKTVNCLLTDAWIFFALKGFIWLVLTVNTTKTLSRFITMFFSVCCLQFTGYLRMFGFPMSTRLDQFLMLTGFIRGKNNPWMSSRNCFRKENIFWFLVFTKENTFDS